jgi:hypothetical protein
MLDISTCVSISLDAVPSDERDVLAQNLAEMVAGIEGYRCDPPHAARLPSILVSNAEGELVHEAPI